jgi:hypothetical protein
MWTIKKTLIGSVLLLLLGSTTQASTHPDKADSPTSVPRLSCCKALSPMAPIPSMCRVSAAKTS